MNSSSRVGLCERSTIQAGKLTDLSLCSSGLGTVLWRVHGAASLPSLEDTIVQSLFWSSASHHPACLQKVPELSVGVASAASGAGHPPPPPSLVTGAERGGSAVSRDEPPTGYPVPSSYP